MSRSALTTATLITWKLRSTSRTRLTSISHRETIHDHGSIGSNHCSTTGLAELVMISSLFRNSHLWTIGNKRGYTREQVRLRQRGVHMGPYELEVLGRPQRLLQPHRHREPVAVRVDLGGVGEQGVVANREVLSAINPGGDPLGATRLGRPFVEPFVVRRTQTLGEERGMKCPHPRLAPFVDEIEFQRSPLRTGGVERGHRHLVAPDVVGVWVAAVLVVGDH